MLKIIESGSQTWALAAADGDLHIYSREEAGEWAEVLLSEDSEQIDQDGSSILEALYEQYAATDQDGQTAAQEANQEPPEDEDEPAAREDQPQDEEEQPTGEEEPEDEEDEPTGKEQPEDDDEGPEGEDEEPGEQQEKKPRRSRARSRAKK